MKKAIISIIFVPVLLLAACNSHHEDGSDQPKKHPEHQKQEHSGNQGKVKQKNSTKTKPTIKVQKMVFPFKKNEPIPIRFTATKDGKPYHDAVLAIQVKLGSIPVPFNAKEVGKGHYESPVRVIKPGTYKARVIEKKGDKIKPLNSFSLKFYKTQ